MEKRMKKEELLKLINSLKISKEEFWILSSGALVLRGIFPDAGDLDIAVTNKGLEELKQSYNLIPKDCGIENFYTVTDKVECVCDGEKKNLKYQPEKFGNYYVQNIYQYLDFLKSSNREKDRERIKIVEDYIEKNYKI